MTETYQEQIETAPAEVADINFATIGAVFTDGVTLIFDGETAATTKHYKVNASVKFTAGQRVKIFKDSGTYIVEYPVGSPLVGGAVTADYVDNAYYPEYQDIKLGWNGTNFYIINADGNTWKKITVT